MLAFVPFILCLIGCIAFANEIRKDSNIIRNEAECIERTIKNKQEQARALVELQDGFSDDGFVKILGFMLFLCGTVYFALVLLDPFLKCA